jgi:basic membrane protein A and related proteins
MKRGAVIAFAALVLLVGGVDANSAGKPKVALVADVLVRPSTRDFRGLEYLGFLRAVKQLPIQGRVVQSNPKRGVADELDALGRQKYDLVYASLATSAELEAAARRFPHTRFLFPYPYALLKSKPRNVEGEELRVEQAGYLVGYLSGLMERRRRGKDVVGSVGGFPLPGVTPWIAGFEAGARRADPKITVLRRYSHDFQDPAKCKAVALKEIARGAGVVFQVAGLCGRGTLEAAREKGIWGIGVDGDESYLGSYVLTSALARYDVGLYRAIKLLTEGRLRTGGNYRYDLANGGVGLGKISPRVPRTYVRDLERVRAGIVAGTITVPSILK